ncbi:hypothetical protein [Butyrivibrio sp. AC2005]|uniref:hypothetical protein n=1 Tax=Butyrivibrio sp. AC2005 TaxID=1280672 RepID=UPI00040112D2|nr:hypothetical protein [Butyrivibrio sp. AC2005]
MNTATLYNIIYGMELFKPRFHTTEAYKKASLAVIEKYEEAHSKEAIIGLVDFNKITTDLDSGDVVFFPDEIIEIASCNYDQWKFLPPELCDGSEWTVKQDLYCLAMVLYAFRYSSLPYDGQQELKAFSQDTNQRKELYRKLHFVFSNNDKDNMLDNLIGASIVSAWDNDGFQVIKELFSLVFEKKEERDVRPDIQSWKKMFCDGVHSDDTTLKLAKDGVEIHLIDGLEINKKDLLPGEDETKIGKVVSSNKDKNVLALGNTSGENWRVDLPDGQKLSVAHQSAAPIVKGAVIDFGFGRWEII